MYVQTICDDADLKEMGLPLGPRKKLLSYLQELRQKQVIDLTGCQLSSLDLARYTLATKLTVAKTGDKSATKSTVADTVDVLVPNRQLKFDSLSQSTL